MCSICQIIPHKHKISSISPFIPQPPCKMAIVLHRRCSQPILHPLALSPSHHWKSLTIDSSIFNMKQYALNNEPSTSLSSNYHHPLGKLPFLLDQMTKFNYRTTNSTPSTL